MKLVERLMMAIGGAAALGTAGLAVMALILTIANLVSSPNEPVAPETIAGQGTAPATTDASATAQPSAETAQTPAAPATPAAAPAATVTPVSAEAGEAVFRQCKACHNAKEGGPNGTGPNLWGVVGRPIGSHEGFAYSDAVAAKSGETWTPEALNAFLEKPRAYIKGNRMGFAGLRKEEDRHNVIAYLASQSATPQSPADLGFAAAAGAAGAVAANAATPETAADATDSAAVEIDPVPWPEGVTYRDPSERTAEEQAEIDARVASLTAEVEAGIDYERARFHPLHFPPQISTASNAECLVCHQEIIDHTPRAQSPAGVPAEDSIAWYQTLDTYAGDQASFHWRHLESDFAKSVMNLECNFCHKGNDPREESPDMMTSRAPFSADATPEFTLRKMVNPSETCLRCHGAMPDPVEIMGLAGPWHEVRGDMEYPEAPNGCLSCHAELYRTARHNVDYLKAHSIEELARQGSSDTCYGCHGGRAWYRISYPYPRHAWPEMFDDELPSWAEGRPTDSDEAYRLPEPQVAAE